MKVPKSFKGNVFSLSVAAVFVLGFIIRIIGIYPGYPPNHPDEPITYLTAIQMVLNKELDPFSFASYKFQYPGLLVYLDAFLFASFFIPLSLLNLLFRDPSFIIDNLVRFDQVVLHAVGPGWINAIFWGRYVAAVLGFLSVPLVYFIGRKLFNQYVGLLASLFVAVNFRHNLSSHLSLLDAPNATFALVVLFVSLLLIDKPNKKNYVFIGIALALSFATKLYFYSFFSFMLAHILVATKKRKPNLILKKFFGFNIIISIFSFVTMFIIFNPFLIFHLGVAYETHKFNNLRYALGSNTLMLSPLWFLYEFGYGKILSILFFLGIIITFFSRRYIVSSIFLLLFIIPNAWFLLYYSGGGGYTRNYTTIIPFALLLSAFALFNIVTFLLKKLKVKENSNAGVLCFVIAGLLIVYPQLKLTLELDYWMSKDWNSTCIKEKMTSTIKNGEIISRTPIVPEAEKRQVTYINHTNFYTNKSSYNLKELQEEKVDYFVFNTEPILGAFIWWTGTGARYWGMPIDIFENSFEGLAIKELSRHSFTDCIYPFPYIGENFSMVKIPKITESELVSLKKINNTFELSPKPPTNISQWLHVSDFIEIKPGEKYIIQGKIHSKDPLDVKLRDGFLRVDFFETKQVGDKRGKIALISSRYYGDSSSKKKEIIAVAPENTRYMRISFQAENYTTNLYLEELEVFLDKRGPSEEEIKISNKKEIDDFIIYPSYIL